jgi:hypothetical protein
MNEDQLYNMSDADLETLFLEEKSRMVNEEIVPNGTGDDLENLDNSQASDLTSETDESNSNEEDDSNSAETSSESETGNEETDDDQSDNSNEEGTEESQPAQRLKYKANGKEYEFTPDEIMQQFPKVFGQAMDYTRKMQAIKPWRKTIDAMEEAKLNHNDVSLLIDVLKGDKTAVAEILKRTGVDALDLAGDTEDYIPKSYGRDESALAIKDVVDEISRDQEYGTTQKILSTEWDETSWGEMTKNPELIKLLHMDVKSGTYNKVQPIAEKLKLFDGGTKSDLDYYKLGAQEYFRELTNKAAVPQQEVVDPNAQRQAKVNKVKQDQAGRQATEQATARRKAAAPTKPGPSKPQGITDYLEDTDEAFDDWYKNLKDNM